MKTISWKAAKEQGLTRYYTGKPCPQGHVAERSVSGRGCVECTYQAKLLSQAKNRNGANRRNRKWLEANREQSREASKRWAENNPGKVLAKAARRRAAKRNAVPVWADSAAIDQTYQCAAALRGKGLDVEVDHILPLQGEDVCGLHVHANLQIISMKANRQKSHRRINHGL